MTDRTNRVLFKPLLSAVVLSFVTLMGSVGTASANQAISKETQQLFDAVRANDLAAVQASLNAGASVDATDRWGMTAPELAVDKGYFKIAHFLASVRHFRTNNESAERTQAAAPAAQPANRSADASSGKAAVTARKGESAIHQPASTATAAAKTQERTTLTTSAPAWPSDRPNPFDPNQLAVGSTIPIIADVGAAGSQQLASAGHESVSLVGTDRPVPAE